VRLVLDTDAAAGADPLRGIGAWSGVDLVAGVPPPEAPPNVLLVSIDTLRADHLSLYGYARPTTPAIDAWAKRSGVTFDNVVAPSPWTLPSHASLFTGWNATRHGVNYDQSAVPGELVLLAEILRKAGWATAAFTGGALLDPRFGFVQGFDRYRYWAAWEAPQSDELRSHVDRALRFLDENAPRPFFLFLHTYEVHTPYRKREPFFSRWSESPSLAASVNFLRPEPPRAANGFRVRETLVWETGVAPRPLQPDEVTTAVAMYDSAIAYADEQIGRLLHKLDELGISDRTLVVLTSDHGELFGEHGEFGHYSLYDENLLVPLVISLPRKFGGGRRVTRQVRLVDVPVTILDLVGAPSLPEPDGTSLAPDLLGTKNDEGLDAWSYAASSNYGIALRLADGSSYVFNNTVWRPDQANEEIRRPTSTGISRGATRREHDIERLRGRARTELAGVPGLRVSFSNREAAPLVGEIRGPVPPIAVKSD
ncbi:MAG: sulfatase, partial [Candidatus Binatia bacterium]